MHSWMTGYATGELGLAPEVTRHFSPFWPWGLGTKLSTYRLGWHTNLLNFVTCRSTMLQSSQTLSSITLTITDSMSVVHAHSLNWGHHVQFSFMCACPVSKHFYSACICIQLTHSMIGRCYMVTWRLKSPTLYSILNAVCGKNDWAMCASCCSYFVETPL